MPESTAVVGEVGWNHNIHYQGLVLEAVPAGAAGALDVGCGEGTLSAALARVVPHVVGLDADAEMLDRSRVHLGERVDLVRGDLLHPPFAPAAFDVVASIATLHHVDACEGLTTLADLVRPGGVLAVVGLARADLPWDLPYELAGAVATRLHRRTKPYREVQAPTVWPPPLTFRQLRTVAEEVLPGVRYRRHAMWRCSLVWERPSSGLGSATRP
jgi:2-polyprenyl-3-methyl-5-hydroxy-6-metoxy-1,4-benzoquinol methylase